MRIKPLLFLATLTLAVSTFTSTAFSSDADCAGCHDTAPVSADHMPIDEVSVASCTMCHAAESDDAFFRSVHDQHGDALGCDACHADDSEARRNQLKEILGG